MAGRSLDFIENNISPEQTKNPCNAERDEFLTEIKILLSLNIRTKIATAAQKIPAIATVVNFGVFFLHLSETVNPANPKDDNKPLIRPNKEPSPLLSKDINIIPPAAIIIDINVVLEIFSLKKIYAKIAATNG